MADVPVLAYWDIRGLAQPIRLLLSHAGQEYEEQLYVSGPPPDFDKSCWFNVKFNLGLIFPNLPYYTDGDIKITQSKAIMRHLARKHNLCATAEKDRILEDILENQIDDYRVEFAVMCYNPDFAKLRGGYEKGLPDKLKQLSDVLGSKPYFLGDKVTFIDFMAYEFLNQQVVFKADSLDAFKNLKEFLTRIEKLPGVANFFATHPAAKYPLNNKMAKFGNK